MLDGQEHGHVPWVFIILKAKEVYKEVSLGFDVLGGFGLVMLFFLNSFLYLFSTKINFNLNSNHDTDLPRAKQRQAKNTI